jgi:exopolyphosphatase/guanosine-5'-triphosphate,3'-diphosphate pyrophosphatase
MEEYITRLGDGLDDAGNLSAEAMKRVVDALLEYRDIGRAEGVVEFTVFATSATREAINREQLLQFIEKETGLRCRVLTGDEEAIYSYLGVISDLPIRDRILVADIGGGSTELILGEGKNILCKSSINIGSRRLHNQFLKSDPVIHDEVERLKRQLEMELSAIPSEFDRQVQAGVAVGGTATTVGMIAGRIPVAKASSVHHYVLKRAEIDAIVDELARRTIVQRRTMIGLNPGRADVILAGAMIFQGIFERFGFAEMVISLRDLLFGVLLDDSVDLELE